MNPFNRANIEFTGQKRSALDMARGRLMLLSLFFIVFYVAIAVKIVDLTIIQGEMKKGEDTVSYLEQEPAAQAQDMRGDILDRNGVILARSLKTSSLYADPKLVADAESVAQDLARIFSDLSYGDLLQKLQSPRRFVWIKRNMTPDDQYKILYLGHPGLSFREEHKRIYPQGPIAAHMVGYTSVDDHGLSGLEASFDKYLMQGREPLTTTLDIRVQHALHREIAAAMKKFSAIGGAGVVMDVNSGEVIAASSLPDFDPQNVSADDKDAMFNRLTLGVFEPGSTFKIFTTAAAIELGGAGMNASYDARTPIKIGRFSISDYHAQKRVMTLPEVFMHSSNIGSVKMAQAVGTEPFRNFLKDLGLFNAPAIELPEVGKPLIPAQWKEVNTMTASFGHGIAVSPLQLVVGASSIMNGGTLVSPTLVVDKTMRGQKEDRSRVRVVSEKTAHRMRQLMRLVVTDGTGGNADVPGFNVGGKTGTADKNEGGRYQKDKRRASFLAFFPSEAPRYAVYVMLDEPKGIKETYGYATAGWVAAPAVKRVVESIVAIDGLRPQDSDELAHTLDDFVKTKKEIAEERRLASFTAH